MNFIKIGQGDFVKEITTEQLGKEDYILYIHTPFCGTYHMARTILSQIETVHQKDLFYEMNASLHPEFMQEIEIESVPCLLIKKENKIKEKVYVFHSVPNIYKYLLTYNPALIAI